MLGLTLDIYANIYEQVILNEIDKGDKGHEKHYRFKSDSSCGNSIFDLQQSVLMPLKKLQKLIASIDRSKAFEKINGMYLRIKPMTCYSN